MTHDSALPNLSSCHALLIRAKYLGGIHLFCCCLHMHRLQIDALSFNMPRTPVHRLMESYRTDVES